MAKWVHQPREDAEVDFILRASGVPVLAYFVGTWAKAIEPCRVMDVVVGDVAEEYAGRVIVVRIDMSRCPVVTERYGIAGAPSVVLLKEGAAVVLQVGPLTGAEVRGLVDGHL